MKILVFTLFLYFSLFATCGIYAANTTLISDYPAPVGSYNKVVLQNLQATPACSASNAGLLFFNTSTNTLQLCAKVNSVPVTIPSGETCFNRFCACAGSCDATCTATTKFTVGNPCPSGYTQAKYNVGQPLVDHFIVTSGPPTYTVYSTVCCSTGSTVLPNS